MKLEPLYVSDIRVWQMSLLTVPSDEEKSNEKVKSIQKQCILNNIAALGFGLGELNAEMSEAEFDLYYEDGDKKIIEGENIKRYLKAHKDEHEKNNSNKAYNNSSLLRALNYWYDIKEGDYIIMHLRDSKYFIGKVKGNKKYYIGGKDNPKDIIWIDNKPLNQFLSWAVDIKENWKCFTEENVPSEISGMFSRRNQSTITPVKSVRRKCLVKMLYDNNADKIKINLTESNFATCMNYAELEDLVSVYIHNENENYYLLPSSTKISRMLYEFTFVNIKDPSKKPISCQVKNRAYINVNDYKEQEQYEKIYLFSGLWSGSDEEYKSLKDGKPDNVFLINRSELFETFIKYKNLVLKKNCESFYNTDECDPLTSKLTDIVKQMFENRVKNGRWEKNYPPKYEIDKTIKEYTDDKNKDEQDDTESNIGYGDIAFYRWDLYYSVEFNKLIVNSSDESIKNMAEYLLARINKRL